MAVTKLWSVKNNLKIVIDYANNPKKTRSPQYTEKQYQALADVIAYAKDEEKTEREFFVEGINCNPLTARDQFVTVKEQYGKTDGIQAYHGYISFKEQNISPELAQKVGMEFANRVWGKRFQVLVTTHLNTKHLHCHFVINSVSYVDGKRLQNDEKVWFKFRHIADEICLDYGLYYNPTPNRSKQSSYYYNKEKAGMPTRYSTLRQAIDLALEHCKSIEDFKYALRDMGYTYQLSPSRKYWTVTPQGYKKPVRLINLGENYSYDAIRKRLHENMSRFDMYPFQRATVVIRQYRLPTREDKIKKIGGLYGLYLYYLYRLGKLPRYKQQNNARLHYYFKEELLKIDELSEQTRLLGKHGIQTDEQLFNYKSSVENEIKTLTADRTHLRKKIRTKIDDVELSQAKEQISQITEKLRKLRKEVKLCNGIADRSGILKTHLEEVLAEEEKSKRKESQRYEQRR